MDTEMLALLIAPIIAGAEPESPANPIVCAFRTLLRLQASAQNITFAQAQANFKTIWNANYPGAQLT